LLLGHADDDVLSAVGEVLRSGIPASGGIRAAQDVAARVIADTEATYQVAFFKTGTMAVRAAAMACRRATGRGILVSAGYHGWDTMWSWPSVPFCVSAAGVFECFYALDELKHFLDASSDTVAGAVISPDYLHITADGLRDLFSLCRNYCPWVVADEVKYGYRYGSGPSICRGGLECDAYVLSKGLSNGWPLACVAGNRNLMKHMAPMVSTLTYEPASLAAARATLRKLESLGVQAQIAREGDRFLQGVRVIFEQSELPLETVGQGNIFQFIAGDEELDAAFYDEAAAAGLLLARHDNQTPSWAFQGTVVDEALDAMVACVDRLKARFARLQRTPLPEVWRWRAAWTQAEGFPATGVNPDTRREFIARCLSA
jgi:glutamate-1-semialdehyde aminotransferase